MTLLVAAIIPSFIPALALTAMLNGALMTWVYKASLKSASSKLTLLSCPTAGKATSFATYLRSGPSGRTGSTIRRTPSSYSCATTCVGSSFRVSEK